MARPFWSGQIHISLVSFGVQLFPATEAKSEIRFHEISRKSGERVRHQKVSEGGADPVEKNDIVKGYEYRKGEYITIEPEEIANLRVPSKHTVAIEQFVDLKEMNPALFEKPYFVVPESDSQAEAFGVVRQALLETGKVGIGKIAFSGREHLIAIGAPSDEKLTGLMAYTMRYPAELRSPASYFADIKQPVVEADQLSLAKELIQRKTAKFAPEKYKDGYEEALKQLVEAKLQHVAPPEEERPAARGKVIDLMEALQRSVRGQDADKAVAPKQSAQEKKPPAKSALKLVTPAKKTAARRRSA